MCSHAEAFTLLKSYHRTHQGIHSAAIIQSHSTIIRRTHPSSCSLYLSALARADEPVSVHALMCSRSLGYTRARALVSAFSARPPAPPLNRARGPGQPADPDAHRKAIARDGSASRELGAGCCCEEQAAVKRSRRLRRRSRLRTPTSGPSLPLSKLGFE